MNGKTSPVFHRLLAATLLVGGLTALSAPALADGTAAGTAIDNTATATYEDQSGGKFDATSNTVKVTVAEVAGITVTNLSTIDRNGGSVLPNDIVDYEFKITNVGNDTTEFYIPSSPNVTGPGTAAQVLITGYIDAAGNRVNFTPIAIPAGTSRTGLLTGLPSLSGNPAGVIPAGFSLIVTVPTTINNLASSGADVTVRLGNTGANDNTPGTQNQLDKTDTPLPDEIRTVDYAGETGASAGPVSDEKEASVSQVVKVGSTSQALATILKTRSSYVPNSLTVLNDDVIGYTLGLKVESTAPVGSTGITPGKLVGTTIKTTTGNQVRVLISDVVPAQTKLTSAADVTVPNSNWTPIYTTEDPATTSALAATWSTAFTVNATRIGFIYDATAPTAALPEGTNLTGFGFKVVTSGVTGNTPVNVLNIAQVFGQTQGNTGGTAPLVYDESGDSMPSNFEDNGVPGTTATLTPGATPGSTTIPSGIPNATNDGVDNNNDNTGKGPGGEDNVTTLAIAGTILNGPNGIPGAVGPTDNNNDFTNRSSSILPDTKPGTKIDPGNVNFTNSINNPGSAPLTNVLVVPDVSGFVASANEQLPPKDTLVTVTYGTQSAVYEFDGTNFVFKSGTAIIIPTLAAGQTVNYDVTVNLPDQTELSTDTGKGFSVPVFAFIDKDGDSRPDSIIDEPTQNRTINRVYTGFLKLVKEARILDKDGATVIQDWTQISGDLAGKGAKDRFIEYRIRYTNISIAPTGTGNVTLDAKNIAIIEDGVNGGNTWAKDNDANGAIDTSHAMGSVSVTYGGPSSILYAPSGEQTGTTGSTDVTKYTHQPGVIIQPQATGTFVFRRKIN
jgi:hypothetical protein